MPGETSSHRARAARLPAPRGSQGTGLLPEGARVVFTGAGTSFHAAQTGGRAVQALEAVLAPPEADLMVVVSHEGGTPVTLEAAEAFFGPKWLVTGAAGSALAGLADEVIVATPEVEASWCHTASYTCAVAAIGALRGEDVAWLPRRGRGGAEGSPSRSRRRRRSFRCRRGGATGRRRRRRC